MILSLLLLVITARVLGPEGRGELATAMSLILILSTLGHLSLGQVALNNMANDENNDDTWRIICGLGFYTIIISVLIPPFFLGIIFFDIIKNLSPAVLFVSFATVPFLIWEQYGSSILAGLERLYVYNRYLVLGRVLGFTIVLTLIFFSLLEIPAILAANLIGQLLVASAGLPLFLKIARKRHQSIKRISTKLKELLSGGLRLHVNALGTILFTSLNVLLINHFVGASEAAFFHIGLQLFNVALVFPQAVNIVIFGKVASLGPDAAWALNKSLLFLSVSLVSIGTVISLLIAPFLISTLFGDGYGDAILTFQIMLIGFIGATISAIMAPQFIGRGFFVLVSGMTIVSGCANLVANILVIPEYGAVGAAVVFAATYCISIFPNMMMFFYCNYKAKGCSSV